MVVSLANRVYEALLASLLEGRYEPGELLNRREVARELGTSVAPVLEAMVRLEGDGFLETLPRKGTRVRLVRPDDVRGQLVVREALECQAARRYAGEPVKQARGDLRPLAKRLDALPTGGREGWQLEVEFHTALVALAACPALMDHFRRVMRMRLFFQINQLQRAAGARPHSCHTALLRGLEAADADAAETLIRDHLHTGKETLQ